MGSAAGRSVQHHAPRRLGLLLVAVELGEALGWRWSRIAAPFGPGVCQRTGRSTVRRAVLGERSCGPPVSASGRWAWPRAEPGLGARSVSAELSCFPAGLPGAGSRPEHALLQRARTLSCCQRTLHAM